MSEDKTVSASLCIEVNVECPYCDEYLNLLNINGLNDEGEVMSQACPSEGLWCDAHKELEVDFECPSCGKTVNVKGIDW